MQNTLRSGQATAAPGRYPAARSRSSRPCSAASHAAPRPRGRREEAAAGGDGFIDHDRVFRNRIGDRLGDRGVVEAAGRLDQFHMLLRLDVRRLGAERIGQSLERGDRIIAP